MKKQIVQSERTAMGKRIKEKRYELGWSQEQLALKAKMSKQTVSKAERGEQGTSTEYIMQMAVALDCSTDYLIYGRTTDYDMAKLEEKKKLPKREEQFVENLVKRISRFVRDEATKYVEDIKENSMPLDE